MQGGAVFTGDLRHGGVDFLGTDAQSVGGEGHPVEFLGQFDHGGVTTGAHIGDDLGHHGIDIRAVLALGVEQLIKGGFEIGGGGIERDGHGGLPE